MMLQVRSADARAGKRNSPASVPTSPHVTVERILDQHGGDTGRLRAKPPEDTKIATLLTVRGKPLTLARIARSIRARLFDREPINACRGVFATFAEATQSAPRSKPLGYDSANSANWYLEKIDALPLEDYPVVFWLREALQQSRSIFEVGGHIGEAFYSFSRVLPYPEGLSWMICDVPSIAAAGEAFAAERQESRLRFTSSLEDVNGADIFLACGALQYVDKESPAQIIASWHKRPSHVLINTTPIYDGPSFVTIQNIGSAYCPYRIFNRQELVASLEALGYSLVDSWRKERQFRIPGHPDKAFDHYSGMYLRLS